MCVHVGIELQPCQLFSPYKLLTYKIKPTRVVLVPPLIIKHDKSLKAGEYFVCNCAYRKNMAHIQMCLKSSWWEKTDRQWNLESVAAYFYQLGSSFVLFQHAALCVCVCGDTAEKSMLNNISLFILGVQYLLIQRKKNFPGKPIFQQKFDAHACAFCHVCSQGATECCPEVFISVCACDQDTSLLTRPAHTNPLGS